MSVTFVAKDKKKQIVYGVVLEPERVDAQDDIISAEEIEQACHKFLEKFDTYDVMHKFNTDKVSAVENYIAPADFQVGVKTIKKGSWVLATHVKDAKLWKKIEKGELKAYSIAGWARRLVENG